MEVTTAEALAKLARGDIPDAIIKAYGDDLPSSVQSTPS